MNKQFAVLGALLMVAIGSSAAADWKLRIMWCASEMAVNEGGDVVTDLQNHADAHERYCKSCGGGGDHFDAALACYEGNDEKWSAIRQEIQKAGRVDVNQFMKPKAPSCCKQ